MKPIRILRPPPRRLPAPTLLLALLVLLNPGLPTARAAVFQYTAPVPTAKGDRTAFLWLPAQAQHIRGVLLGGMTLMEREFARDPQIRAACAAEQLAIVFLNCGLGAVDLQRVLNDLAQTSGYHELAVAPLMFVGHSAGGPQAKAAAIQMASRCFGLVLYRGGVPGGRDPVLPGIPVLIMIGQFDEFGGTMRNEAGRETWEGGRDALAAYRALDERHLASIVVEPGAGHFAWSDRNAAYLAQFIRKAAQARIPSSWPITATTPPALREVNPRNGWLTDLTIKNPGSFPPAPHDQYQGPRTNTAWHFDRQLAEATLAYHAGGFEKQDQFIRWTDPHWVDAGARFFFTKIAWVGDGQTFAVHAVYADHYPNQYKGAGPRWPLAGEPVGHSTAPICVRHVSGPVAATGSNTLRLTYDNLTPATDGGRATFLAFSDGNAEYRYTEQIGMLPRGFSGLKSGQPQSITFPPLNRLKAGSPPVKLNATSNAGLPVEFYVAYGPALVTHGLLQIQELPARARFPLQLKVVAWQFGRGLEPLVQTATPVEQTLHIEHE